MDVRREARDHLVAGPGTSRDPEHFRSMTFHGVPLAGVAQAVTGDGDPTVLGAGGDPIRVRGSLLSIATKDIVKRVDDEPHVSQSPGYA